MSKRFEQAKKYTEKYKSILLPCRICGNADVRIVSYREIFGNKNLWGATCSSENCECTGVYANVKDAVKRWNEMNSRSIK